MGGQNMFQQWEAKHLMISVFVSLSGQQGLSGARLGDQGTTAQKKMQNYSAATATHLKQGWLVVWCQHAAAAP